MFDYLCSGDVLCVVFWSFFLMASYCSLLCITLYCLIDFLIFLWDVFCIHWLLWSHWGFAQFVGVDGKRVWCGRGMRGGVVLGGLACICGGMDSIHVSLFLFLWSNFKRYVDLRWSFMTFSRHCYFWNIFMIIHIWFLSLICLWWWF